MLRLGCITGSNIFANSGKSCGTKGISGYEAGYVHTLGCIQRVGEWRVGNEQPQYRRERIRRLINVFNPQSFDAKKWVAIAKAGGMKYITFITRHHDGFSNWDTKQSDWKITKTPYAKDALKQLADECHKEGIKLFCYYSLLDWYRNDYQYETGKTGKGTGRTQRATGKVISVL